MAKTIGISAVVLGALGVIFAITVFSFRYAYCADAKVDDIENRVIVTEVRVEGFSIDLKRLETAQKEMGDKIDSKLDRVLERLPE